MYKNIIIGLLAISSFASASNGFKSELSHFIGGLIMTILVAYLINRFLPKHKAKSVILGFLASIIFVTVDQSLDYIKDGEFLNQLLDFSVHTVGSVVGLLISMRFIKSNNI